MSKDKFDWNKEGVWAAYNEKGVALLNTVAVTPALARAKLFQHHNLLPSERNQYSIREHKQTSLVARVNNQRSRA
jgi:hypothetical protein